MMQSILHFLLPINFQCIAHKKHSINIRMHKLAMWWGAFSAHFTALLVGYTQVHDAINDPTPLCSRNEYEGHLNKGHSSLANNWCPMVLLIIMSRFLAWLFIQEMKDHTDSEAGTTTWLPHEKSNEGRQWTRAKKTSREKGNGAEKVVRKVALFVMLPSCLVWFPQTSGRTLSLLIILLPLY